METENKCAEGTVCNNLGVVYQSLNNFEKAYEFFQRALSKAKETENKYAEGTVYNSFGVVNHCLGDCKEAIECYQLALRMAEADQRQRFTRKKVYQPRQCLSVSQ